MKQRFRILYYLFINVMHLDVLFEIVDFILSFHLTVKGGVFCILVISELVHLSNESWYSLQYNIFEYLFIFALL